jgi:hypothetical protein
MHAAGKGRLHHLHVEHVGQANAVPPRKETP